MKTLTPLQTTCRWLATETAEAAKQLRRHERAERKARKISTLRKAQEQVKFYTNRLTYLAQKIVHLDRDLERVLV